MCIPNYIFGTFKKSKQKIPFVFTPWINGRLIKKKEASSQAFELGKQYEFCRWLCLYDCQPRHYFLQPDSSFRRIDFGLAFSKFKKLYEGFADIWPKALFSDPDFMAGMKYENQKIRIRFEIVKDLIWEKIELFSQLKISDFVNIRGERFKFQLLKYWQREGILDDCGHLKTDRSFLHSPISVTNACEEVVK